MNENAIILNPEFQVQEQDSMKTIVVGRLEP